MNWLSFLPILIPLLQSVSQAWGSSTGNSLQKVGSIIAHAPAELVDELASLGGKLFPNLDPALHAAAAALLAAESHTGAASWVQGALNIAQSAGIVKFGPALVIDGRWGPKSTAALKALQTHLGLPVTGMFADAEFQALNAILAKA